MQTFGKSESIMPYWTGFGWYASLWIEQACWKLNVELALCSKCISWLCEISSQSYVIVFMTMKWGIRLRLILVKASVSLQQNGVFVHMAGQTCWSLQWQVYIVNNSWILEWKASSFVVSSERLFWKKVNLEILLLIVHFGTANQNNEPLVRMHMVGGPLHGKFLGSTLFFWYLVEA